MESEKVRRDVGGAHEVIVEVTDPAIIERALRNPLANIDFVASFSGHKSSEGDGRTAADIEEERRRGLE